MKKTKITALFASLLLMLASCEDFWDPQVENYRDEDEITEEAELAFGILLNGYNRIPTSSWSFNDVATDDAVSNNTENSYLEMATGSWTSSNNPMSRWDLFTAIQYMNQMLEISDDVNWDSDSTMCVMFSDRTKGEAYALRGLHMYYLLQGHAGPVSGGSEMMGVPIYLESLDTESDFNVARSTFQECYDQMNADFDMAEELLPLDFETATSVPDKYEGVALTDYNSVFGNYSRGRITRRIVEALRSRATLMAASPSFNTDDDVTLWEDAADAAATVLDRISGVSGLSSTGYTWYANTTEIDNLAEGSNPSEILWRGDVSSSSSLEEDNYPPTLYGSGRVNPTQNLVDAFPMANGYPIDDDRSGYDSGNPTTSRDPRLSAYILFDGGTAGPSSTTITTLGTSTNDCVNQTETSTRTGYYMRKLLRQDVNLNPLYANTQKHYVPHIRYTEIFLNYAEAANEAYGPKGTGSHSYSAYDVIKAIRQRAGVGGTSDPYLEECAADQDLMRELIRNERRLELCFEGFRFWDLRRWKVDLDKLNETARGTNMTNNVQVYNNVETRSYKDYMYYGPIPYSEVLKWSNLEQNTGW